MNPPSTSSPAAVPLSVTDATAALEGVCRLSQLGVIRAAGDDAAKFLHNQLTQDFLLLDDRQARLAALCSAKGRMQASFIGFRHGPADAAADVLLVCSLDLLAPTLKRLSMFVLRAKVKLSDASAQFALWGLAGAAVAANAGTALAPWSRCAANKATAIGLYPAEGVARALWITPAQAPAPAGEALASELWDWSEVASGIATVSAPIVEAFVPQMLNYESVGGVSFKKGCYPGQEVVARSQFRGTLKRRAYRVHCESALAAGDEVFFHSGVSPEQGRPDEPCGTVAQAAIDPAGGFAAIVSMQTAAAAGSGRLTAQSPDGPALTLLPLPYPLLADI